MPRRRYKAKPTARPKIRIHSRSVAVIGTGLIGASIGLASRAAGFNVVGWDAKKRALCTAKECGAISQSSGSLKDAVAAAKIVVLAAPLDQVLLQLSEVFAHARSGALVMDVAGVKEPVAKRGAVLSKRRRDICFVAGHPIAGSERSGPAAADAMLLVGRAFAIHAPPQDLREQAYTAAARFIKKLGAIPVRIDPRDHDRAIAALSALPQLSSIALSLASGASGAVKGRRLAGPGYRDTTRLAESGFATWKPALSANRKNVLRAIRALRKRVSMIEEALRRRDWAALEGLFSAAARARRRVNPR
jgi:prephenate dehydrogenase